MNSVRWSLLFILEIIKAFIKSRERDKYCSDYD